MINLSIGLQFVLAIMLSIAVLLQKSSSIGLGAYSGSNESMFGAKGPAGFLAKATFAIGLIFIVNTVFLTYYFNKQKHTSVIDTVKVLTPTQTPAAK
jgi:preprotein translocase subunit SecG